MRSPVFAPIRRPLPASAVILAVAAIALAVLAARGGDSGGITGERLERSFAKTFANLVALQVAKVGGLPIDAEALRASAQCAKSGAATKEPRGAGDWVCDLAWYGPARRAALHDRYEVQVIPDGCFTASADGEEAHVGGPTLVTRDGTKRRNLVYAFEGCLGGP